MVVVKIEVGRQYAVVVIAGSLNTIYALVRRIKKCPIYIVPIDFN